MRTPCCLLRCACIIACITAASAAEPAAENKTLAVGDTGARIVALVEKAESAGFSGSVLAAKGGEVIAAVGVGQADLKGEVRNTPATLFEIASATKQFTSAAVMRLVQDGRVKLDEPISTYLPGVPDNCGAITARHLLQHTSGIPGTNSMGAGEDLAAVLPFFLRGGPKHAPGTRWEYWNQGYALATEIIARAADKSYTDYCKAALFLPAGMSVTCFTGDEPPEGTTVAVGRSPSGSPRSALEHPYGSYGFQYRGMGGAVTNVWDLWRWDRALRNDEEGCILGKAAKTELFKPGLNDYALGWFVREDASGRQVQSHGGGVRGFSCEIRRYPTENGCVFVLCNTNDAPVGSLIEAVSAILFGDPVKFEHPPRAMDAAQRTAIAGRYKTAKGQTLIVKPDADGSLVRAQLIWSAEGGPVTRAILGIGEGGELVLFDWHSNTRITKSLDANGAVVGLSMDAMHFERVAGK